jgi:hypothetical protein
MEALDQSISMIIELLKVPVDILGVESDGIAVLVDEILGVEGGEVVSDFLDDFHCSGCSNLISQIYNFYIQAGMVYLVWFELVLFIK